MSEITAASKQSPAAEPVAPHPMVADQAVVTARYAVVEYLRDIGIRDPDLVAVESHRIVADAIKTFPANAPVRDADLAEAAVRLTVGQLDQWLPSVSESSSLQEDGPPLGHVVCARLPGLLGRYPQVFQKSQTPAAPVEAVQEELIPVVPQPKPRRMRRQNLSLLPRNWPPGLTWLFRRLGIMGPQMSDNTRAQRARRRRFKMTPARLTLISLTLISTILAVVAFDSVISRDGIGLFAIPLLALFSVLFLWVAFSFWMATLGLIVILRRQWSETPAASDSSPAGGELPTTAILMPVYNEDPAHVFANLRAIVQSLRATGQEKSFNLFVLSDTTNPDIWLEEERTWAQMAAELPAQCHVFYRHRPRNTSRKSGNIADFCKRWGEHYKYMIVLDADSVMAGETLVEMVRRLERDPRIGILQVPPTPVNRQSFFARLQQFAARVYGPIFTEGFAQWALSDSNYWGHNAIIRVRPFMQHCDLPVLPGEGPLSGEILSHDFVEAALMRRAGWKVCLAHDLDGSFEECPTTIFDYAQRDQRWCQGNLQHIRLLFADGFHPASRLHLGMGVMSYLASPLWLAFLILTILGAYFGTRNAEDTAHVPSGIFLFALTMGMLLLPKLWGVIALTQRPRPAPEQAVWGRVWGGVLIETVVSILVAPIMMLLHTQFVISTLLGTKVTWNAQQRDDRGVSLGDALWMHGAHTLLGLLVGTLLWFTLPGLLPWMSPVLLGLILSIPLSMVLGSITVGRALARSRLLLTPEEVAPPDVLKYQRTELARLDALEPVLVEKPKPFVAVFRDPTLYALHIGILRATGVNVPISPELQQRIEALVLAGRFSELEPDVRRAVLNDRRALETLHILCRSHLVAVP